MSQGIPTEPYEWMMARLEHQSAEIRASRQRRLAAVVACYEGKTGHAWDSGPWHRECVRCGLTVRSLASGREKYRRIEGHLLSKVVLEGTDADLPPCYDGEIGEYTTARQAAPWEHA